MILSPHEVAWVVQRTWPSTTIAEQEHAVAVALAESGGDTDIIARSADTLSGGAPNPNAGNRDHGLFQLSGRWQWDKIIAAGGDWRDPLVNSTVAFAIYVAAGRKFIPWHVYTSESAGSWLTRLPDAKLAVPHPFPIPTRYLGGQDLDTIEATLATMRVTLGEIRVHFA